MIQIYLIDIDSSKKKEWFKQMRRKKIVEIIIPYQEGTPHYPCVSLNDKIIHAIELMVTHNLGRIVVVRNKRPVGMVRLEDAFGVLGLKAPVSQSVAYGAAPPKKS